MWIELNGQAMDAADLVRQVFSGLQEALPALSALARDAGNRIRIGEAPGPWIDKIVGELSVVIGAYQDGERLLRSSELLNGHTGETGRSAAVLLEEVLKELLSALQSGDSLGMGDILEHELTPALSELGAALRHWNSAISKESEIFENGAEN